MIHTATTLTPPQVASLVLRSTLDYPTVEGTDARLACWRAGEGSWAVAWEGRALAGIACLVTLTGAPWNSFASLYWLEVLPNHQRLGVGQALLTWALAQQPTRPFVIAATPGSASFYRRQLALQEIQPLRFVRQAADVALPHAA